ncbi:MAG: sugar-transfer associated ATP-grasp domain-containing protein [Bacilli bacterium]
MKQLRRINDYIGRKARLALIWIVRILFAPSHMKVPFFKRLYYNIKGGYIGDQVALYNLNSKNQKEYLSEFDWYRSRYINGNYKFILNNKIVCTELLKQYIKVPTIYALKQKKAITSFDSDITTSEKIVELLEKQKKLFLKPIDCGKGSGVVLLKYENKNYYTDQKQVSKQTLIEFLDKNTNYFISENITQNKYQSNLYDKTTNTLRLVTFKDPETEKFILYFAVQRIGTKDTIPVDNGSKGGLVAKVDLENGTLSAAKCLHNLNEYKVHPDSKNQIEGVKIPDWKKIKKEIVELSNRFPYLNFIAWDVLLTDKGICIIEANTSSGVNILQLWGGQKNKKLGDLYRYHGLIK